MKYKWTVAVFVILIIACKQQYQLVSTQPNSIKVNADSLQLFDSALFKLIMPYKAKLDSQMNTVVGSTQTKLTKAKPESTLGNLVCEAVMNKAAQRYGKPIDAGVFNYGGIRIAAIDSGLITLNQVYELMPFDNQIAVLEINGSQLNKLIQLTAAADGWPIAGIRYQLQNGKADSITIRNAPLDTTQTYVLATSDYLANGGDKAEMLKNPIATFLVNTTVRDAIMEYIQQNSPLLIKTDGRIKRKP
ncbi:MAG: 5'-nucleotidase C-terminal domain-containing protein [Bacteroidia bacterium]|jgi:2',3'-cyclic-nucleotide 2'-phosphodiesterase (5'-nucleotidase family)|nr:5'-nucleotidase C-terminal domain-containing protein [Bacteroidia bacterium]